MVKPLTYKTPAKYTLRDTRINKEGYTEIYLPDHPLARRAGWAAEHRVVVFDRDGEIPKRHHVHHIDGNKQNNDPDNLQVMSPSEHFRISSAESFAKAEAIRLGHAVVLVIVASVLSLAVLALKPADDAQAVKPYCTGKPMPVKVCKLIYELAPKERVSRAWASSTELAYILHQESGYNFCAVYPSQSNCRYTGRNSCGIAQRQPCNLRVFRSQRLQIRDFLGYIRDRYRTPERALSFKLSHGWY
jgi:hypothetical protein